MTRPALCRRYALLAAIVVVGATLRLTGLDWDQGQHLHPDERFLTMVATDISAPGSLAEYLDTARSPANPAHVGHPFFVYGTFPLFLTRAVATVLGLDSYERVHLVGRVLSALFDCGTIVLVWLLGRLLAGDRVGLAAAALAAVSVPSIQSAHFFTVDSFAAFFATAALLGLLRVARGGGARDHLLFGVGFGLALACRVNLVLLAPFYALAAARAVRVGRRPLREALGRVILATGAAALVLRLAHPYMFAGPGLLDVSLSPGFLASMARIRAMVAGEVHFPPALQWIGRTPVLYPARNLFMWNLGPAWGVAALAGMVWFPLHLRRGRGVEGEGRALGLLVWLWTATLFLFHASRFAATTRYLLPLVPCLAVFAVWPLARGRLDRRSGTVLAVVLGATTLWALAFTAIYREEHTRVQASRWIAANVPPGSTVAVEHWDDALPLPLEGAETRYERTTLPVYDEDTVEKRRALVEALDEADCVVLSSNRGWGSIPRSPWRYPLTRRYYELLLGEGLGFRRERVFTSSPRLGPLEIDDGNAEEAFSVYDHPRVLVFLKGPGFSRERVARLLGAVPLDVLEVSPKEASPLYRATWPTSLRAVPGAREGPALPGGGMGSLEEAVRWLGGLELSALAVFALLVPLLGIARDRGFALSKVLGWLAPGSLVFAWCAWGLGPCTPGAARAAALLLWTAGALAAWRHRALLGRLARERWGEWTTVQAVFWAAFALFGLLRALNPAIFWGEKPMDFAILNALYRARTLPPVDPWFAGEPLGYGHFGHLLVATLGRVTGVPPALAFNLGIATLGALLAVAAFAAGRQIADRRAGLLAAGGTVLLGNLAGVRLALAQPGRELDFGFFWATSRVIPGTINEYPFWSLLFGDLHAHLLALPFDMALVLVASLWLAAGDGASRGSRVLVAVLAAWLGGASVATSPWNLPVALAVPGLFLATAWWRGGRGARRLLAHAGLLAGTGVLAGLLYLPAYRALGWRGLPPLGWETEAASLVDVWTLFGLFFLVVLPVLGARLRGPWSPRGRALLGLAGLAAVGVAWTGSASAAFSLGMAALAAAVWLREREAGVQTAAALVMLAGGIAFTVETVHVSDRMNTVFKYSLHVWLLLALAAGILLSRALAVASASLRPVWRDLAAVGVVCGLFTSAAVTIGLLREPPVRSPTTLDGARYLRAARPSEAEAFRWIAREVEGSPVVLEAQGPPYQLYSRVSMNTGLPTVLGWEHHLRQQGRPRPGLEARRRDVRTLFDTTDRGKAAALMDRYDVDLVFLGPLERRTYSAEGLSKFDDWARTRVAFRNRDVTIHARPGALESTRAWSEPLP